MKKRITIKDIAEKAGVSVGTVHCALTGKPGVGDATRVRVQEIAHKYNYQSNSVAASLKRKTIRVAAAFPGPTEENRFYYTYVWEGINDYLNSMSDFNIELIEVPYYNGVNNQADELTDLLKRTEVDGLLTADCTDSRGKAALQQFSKKGIPIILVGNDIMQSGRLCCVQPNYQIIGRTLAELLMRQIPADGGILLCAGDVMIPAHYNIVQGFDAYMQERNFNNPVYKIHANKIKQEVYDYIVDELQNRSNIAACCCVNARGSVMLGQALIDTKKAGTISAIGSDLFEENMDFLRDGVFTNLLNKNPYSQAYLSAKYLVEYLLRNVRPPQDTVYVGSEIVYQSSLPLYENGSYRLLV